MRKFIFILMVVAASLATTPGCAFIQGQRQTLATISVQDFTQLKVDVKNYGMIAGAQIKGQLTPAQVSYADTVVRLIFERSNQDRAKVLASFAKDPQYQALLDPAISATLDLIEAAIGERLQIESLGTTTREVELVEALLLGILEGMK
jgi:hypothetical protein